MSTCSTARFSRSPGTRLLLDFSAGRIGWRRCCRWWLGLSGEGGGSLGAFSPTPRPLCVMFRCCVRVWGGGPPFIPPPHTSRPVSMWGQLVCSCGVCREEVTSTCAASGLVVVSKALPPSQTRAKSSWRSSWFGDWSYGFPPVQPSGRLVWLDRSASVVRDPESRFVPHRPTVPLPTDPAPPPIRRSGGRSLRRTNLCIPAGMLARLISVRGPASLQIRRRSAAVRGACPLDLGGLARARQPQVSRQIRFPKRNRSAARLSHTHTQSPQAYVRAGQHPCRNVKSRGTRAAASRAEEIPMFVLLSPVFRVSVRTEQPGISSVPRSGGKPLTRLPVTCVGGTACVRSS